MKKISFWAVAASVACLSLIGCKSKSGNNTAEADGQAATTEQTEVSEAATGNEPVAGALEDSYNVCPFSFQVEGKVDAEGNPVTVDRKWIMGSSVGISTVADWVFYTLDSRFPLNVDGWHFVGKDIVNADETYKINDEDAWMSLSSFCTIRTEKYTKPEKVEPYEHVTFKRIYSVDDAEFEAPLIKTSGNQHEYTGEAKEYIDEKELQDRAITSFYLQEWVTVSLPAELANQNMTLAVVRHQPNYENVTFDADKLSDCLWTGKPELDAESGYATVSFYVNEEQPVGFYDLLFITNQKAQHCLTLVMLPAKK